MSSKPKLPPFEFRILENLKLLTFEQQVNVARAEVELVYGSTQLASIWVNQLPSAFQNRISRGYLFHHYTSGYSFAANFNVLDEPGAVITFNDPNSDMWPRKKTRACFARYVDCLDYVRNVRQRLDLIRIEIDISTSDAVRSAFAVSLLMLSFRLDNQWPIMRLPDGSVYS